MPVVQWRPVVRFDGLYEVSDTGQVRSLDRMVRYGDGRVSLRHGRVLRQWRGASGYLHVVLSGPAGKERRKVHQLVAEAFIGPRLPGLEVRHGSAGQLENSVANLCYGTTKENAEDRIRDGTAPQGSAHPRAKLTEDIVRECRRRAASTSSAALAREFGVEQSVMRKAITGKTWRLV